MKRLIKVLCMLTVVFATSYVIVADVYVEGYYRSNGTYVKPHYRSDPDGKTSNNWSTSGNVNPYTGAIGTKNNPSNSSSTVSISPKTNYTQSPATVRFTPDPKPINPTTPIKSTNTINLPDGFVLDKPEIVSVTENHWQVALNNNYFKGRMETVLSTGRADIENDLQVVEVDKVSKYLEGIEQVLRYAKATGKKPVLALYIDGEPSGFDILKRAEILCYEKQVKLILANCYVSTNDLISLIDIAKSESEKSKKVTSDEMASTPKTNTVKWKDISEKPILDQITKPVQKEQTEMKYWITTSTSVRHNSSCRYYMNSKGRLCTKNEGRACKICGG